MRFPVRESFPLLVRIVDKARWLLAWLWRRMLYRTTIIAITGSVGKTTTKEFLGKILATRFPTITTFDTDNGTVGLPKSILKIRPWHRYAVLEAATGNPGDLAKQAALIRPDAAVILNVRPVHIRKFDTPAAIQKEKGELAAAVGKDGWVLLNGDDPRVREMKERCRSKVVWFGSHEPGSFRAEQISNRWPGRLSFHLCKDRDYWKLQSRLVGEHWAVSLSAAIAAACYCGIPPEDAVRAAEEIQPYTARMEPVRTPNGAWIIRDELNSSYVSWIAALRFLKEAGPLKRWIILSDVSDLEIGSHEKIRRLARELLDAADFAVLLGVHAGELRKRLVDIGFCPERIFIFRSCQDAASWLAARLTEEDLALLRGHSSHHLSRIFYGLWGPVGCAMANCSRRCLCDFCRDLYRGGFKPPDAVKDFWRPIYY
jgi:UDP-N-acetylmuramoyl-tripeptide--D-alanyl-D-alanine ligase